jgi:hypothetical protein
MRDSDDLGLLSQRVPRHVSRAGRVLLVSEVAEQLSRGSLPSPEARMFVASALLAWLSAGGDLVKDHLRIAAPRGSHHRPEVLYRRLLIADERQDDSDRATFGSTVTEGDSQ